MKETNKGKHNMNKNINNTIPGSESIFEMLSDLIASARKADTDNAVVNAYLLANPNAAKTLLSHARSWKSKEDMRRKAEEKVAKCRESIKRTEAAIQACHESIGGWTNQIAAAESDIACLEKILKTNLDEYKAADIELKSLK